MLDTIRTYLHQDSCPNTELISEIPARLTDITSHSEKGRVWYSGYIKNLKWNVNELGLSLSGSLPKFYYGDNLIVMGKDDLNDTFKKLSHILQLDLFKANLTQIDFGINLECEHSVKNYFKYLGHSPYYNSRNINHTTLAYSNSVRTKLFYDKLKEMKTKGEPVPKHFKNKNIMRYEVRYRKRWHPYFKSHIKTVGDLINSDFFGQLKTKLNEEFESIKRVRLPILKSENIKTTAQFRDQMAALAINDRGVSTVQSLIEECDNMNYQNKSRSRRKCLELVDKYSPDCDLDLYDELFENFRATLVDI